METIKRLSEVDPRDLIVVERVFGQRIETTRVVFLILRTDDPLSTAGSGGTSSMSSDVPNWCDVLEGMTEQDLADLSTTFDSPVRLTSRITLS